MNIDLLNLDDCEAVLALPLKNILQGLANDAGGTIDLLDAGITCDLPETVLAPPQPAEFYFWLRLRHGPDIAEMLWQPVYANVAAFCVCFNISLSGWLITRTAEQQGYRRATGSA